jgi:hypothetical protein
MCRQAMQRNGFTGAGVAFGIAAGSLISLILGDFALWTPPGVCLGGASGAALSPSNGRDEAA